MSHHKLPSNRRASQRKRPKRVVRVACFKGTMDLGRNLTVTVLDVSQTGIRLIVSASLNLGQEVSLRLETIGNTRPLKLSATVVWSVATADENYCVGLQFRKNLPYPELSRMT